MLWIIYRTSKDRTSPRRPQRILTTSRMHLGCITDAPHNALNVCCLLKPMTASVSPQCTCRGRYVEALCSRFWWPCHFCSVPQVFAFSPAIIPGGKGWQGLEAAAVETAVDCGRGIHTPHRVKRACGSRKSSARLWYKELPRLDASRSPLVPSFCRIHQHYNGTCICKLHTQYSRGTAHVRGL